MGLLLEGQKRDLKGGKKDLLIKKRNGTFSKNQGDYLKSPEDISHRRSERSFYSKDIRTLEEDRNGLL